ncbi:putative monooxygenase [Aspergillus alliaceus]|uniref:putative monooxygenase n=1 Tax=Petromyces alliaceus TaxID=209559 RepID=UPI0012A6418C|nr:uncharacterized protein BDW43DRAFT_298687 [Aspergillus alliaceus]KAB8235631.1 hypothetical protein BDW43DRAFT_298687 [Aspergillus alliaceus]
MTDVVICGCGPTEAMLLNYLSQMSISNVILEREADISTDPAGIGIYDPIYSEIGSRMGRFNFIGGTETALKRSPFSLYSTMIGGAGHIGLLSQATQTRKKLPEEDVEYHVLRFETVFELREDGNWTYSKYHDAQGMEWEIRARFPVGADGKTGFTRENYLGPKGVHMEKVTEYVSVGVPTKTWVALNWHITLPTPESHPQCPLWKLGYTLEQVYDIFFPDEFRFLCNPNRPAVFEFVVRLGEDGYEKAKPEWIKKIVFPNVTYHGSPYNDAAHVFPPFGGQGSAFGFRDAVSLAWRPALLCRYHPTTPKIHKQFLSAWCQNESNSLKRLLKGSLKLPQVFCKDMSGKVSFTEDVIFRSEQNSLFRLFVYLRNDEELEPARNAMRVTQEISRGEFGVDNISFIVEQITCDEASDYKNLFQIANAEDFAQSPLCNGRPKPTYYEPFLVRKEVCGEYIIVRPDRFVFAACDGDQSLKVATNCMLEILYSSLESTTA